MQCIDAVVDMPPTETEAALRAALAVQGFGVLTEIDVAAVLRDKLGIERPFLKILGACNPTFAQRALALDPSVSLLLPCNVAVEATASKTKISAVDPLSLMGDPAFAELAREVATRLRGAVDAVARNRKSPG